MSNCKGLPFDVFYGLEENKPMNTAQLRAARGMCKWCPARRDCLADALRNDERFGIWGGFTAPERARIIRIYSPKRGSKSARTNLMVTRAMAALASGVLETKVVVL